MKKFKLKKFRIIKDKSSAIIVITIGILSLLLAMSLVIQFKSVDVYKETDLEGLRDEELKTQIATYKSRYEEAEIQVKENQNKINEYTSTANENENSERILDAEIKQTDELLGLTDVNGTGIIITLTEDYAGVILAEDLRDLVNELKYAGAEAISINDNRVINLTDIVTINEQFIVMYGGNMRIASPYVIKAIGDTKYLTSTLNMKNSGFVDTIKSSSIGESIDISIKESNNLTITKYNRDIESNYMKTAE